VDIKLAMRQQRALTAKTASNILVCIRKSIASRSREVIFRLYSAVLRPHLKSCALVWAPWYKKDMDSLK